MSHFESRREASGVTVYGRLIRHAECRGRVMMKSNALRALKRSALLHRKAFGISFLTATALVVLAMAFWPGGAPLAVPVVGAVAALAIGVLVPWLLVKRQPYLRTVEDVERTLRLPVVARYSPSLREDW